MIISMSSPVRLFQQYPTVDCGNTDNLAIEMDIFRPDFLGYCFDVFLPESSALYRATDVLSLRSPFNREPFGFPSDLEKVMIVEETNQGRSWEI